MNSLQPFALVMKSTVFFGALLFVSLTSVQAQLAWEKKEIELHPKAGDAEAVANFKYENKGKTPIKITAVKSSCGCTAASTQKDEVAPGEKGEVVATFKIGGRTGLQQKSVTVESNDPSQPVTTLLLKANIEQPIEVQPTFVFWQSGEEPKPKTVKAKMSNDLKSAKLDVSSSNPDFSVKVEKGSAAGEYNINVQPKDTAQPATSTLTIKSDMPQPLFVMARVVAQAPAPAPAASGH